MSNLENKTNNLDMIIDLSNFIHRNYHAYPNLTSNKGIPTGGFFGALKMIKKLQDDYSPNRIILCSDFSRKSFRTELFSDYKGNRPETPAELKQQFALMEKFCELSGLYCIKMENYEADDLIASFAKQSVLNGNTPYIVSGDRDLFQCVTEDIKMIYASTKDGFLLFDLNKTKEKYSGLFGEQIVELKAISGDTSDNYKGIPGVGEKGALKLLQEFKTIDGIYENINLLKGKQKENFENNKVEVYRCKTLAKIVDNLPVTLPSESFISFNKPEVKEFLRELSIHSL